MLFMQVLIFTSGKKSVDNLVGCLRQIGWPAVGIHSGKEQAEREWVVEEEEAEKFRIKFRNFRGNKFSRRLDWNEF